MIHPTAIVDPGARIGSNVEIGPYTIIGPHVEIGDHTVIGPHTVIKGHTRIGRENRIFQFCSLGEVPQDKKYAGEPTRLEIGDRNVVREFCTFNLGTVQDNGVTRIGDDNWIMAYVQSPMIVLSAISAPSPTMLRSLVMSRSMTGLFWVALPVCTSSAELGHT